MHGQHGMHNFAHIYEQLIDKRTRTRVRASVQSGIVVDPSPDRPAREQLEPGPGRARCIDIAPCDSTWPQWRQASGSRCQFASGTPAHSTAGEPGKPATRCTGSIGAVPRRPTVQDRGLRADRGALQLIFDSLSIKKAGEQKYLNNM